jgi:hypothetical protein
MTYQKWFLTLFFALAAALPAGAQDAPAPAVAVAQQRHVDRLAILATEHQDVTRRLFDAKAKSTPDEAEIRSLETSLEALNIEIAFVQKQPVYEMRADGPTVARRKPPAPSASLSYDAWDVFKNFGREDAQTQTE